MYRLFLNANSISNIKNSWKEKYEIFKDNTFDNNFNFSIYY